MKLSKGPPSCFMCKVRKIEQFLWQHSHKYLADFNSVFSWFTTRSLRFLSVGALGVLSVSLDSSRKLIRMSRSGGRKGSLLTSISCPFFFFSHHSVASQFLGYGSAIRIEIAFTAVNVTTLHRMDFLKEMEKPQPGQTLCLVIQRGRGNICGISVFRSVIRALPDLGEKKKERRIKMITCHIEVFSSYLWDGGIQSCMKNWVLSCIRLFSLNLPLDIHFCYHWHL